MESIKIQKPIKQITNGRRGIFSVAIVDKKSMSLAEFEKFAASREQRLNEEVERELKDAPTDDRYCTLTMLYAWLDGLIATLLTVASFSLLLPEIPCFPFLDGV